DREHFAFFFARDVYFRVARVHAHTFGFLGDFYFAARLPRTEIHNQSAGVVFVCDEGEFSIFADCELLRVGPDMPAVDQFARYWIDHTETVSGLVRRRAIFIDAGRHSW